MQDVFKHQPAGIFGYQTLDGLDYEVGIVFGVEKRAQYQLLTMEVVPLVALFEACHELIVQDAHVMDGARQSSRACHQLHLTLMGSQKIRDGIAHSCIPLPNY